LTAAEIECWTDAASAAPALDTPNRSGQSHYLVAIAMLGGYLAREKDRRPATWSSGAGSPARDISTASSWKQLW